MTNGQKHIDVPAGATVRCYVESRTDGPIPLYRLRVQVNDDTYVTDPTPDGQAMRDQAEDFLQQLQANGGGRLVEYDGAIVGRA